MDPKTVEQILGIVHELSTSDTKPAEFAGQLEHAIHHAMAKEISTEKMQADLIEKIEIAVEELVSMDNGKKTATDLKNVIFLIRESGVDPNMMRKLDSGLDDLDQYVYEINDVNKKLRAIVHNMFADERERVKRLKE